MKKITVKKFPALNLIKNSEKLIEENYTYKYNPLFTSTYPRNNYSKPLF